MNLRFDVLCICAALSAASALAEETGLADVEVWNKGVSAYRDGDLTNAVEILRPLVLTKKFGPRAAEVVGSIEFARAKKMVAENPSAAYAKRVEAAEDMAIALRANPDDARANRNYTRAVDGLEDLRENAHVADVLKKTQGQQPGDLLGSALAECRGAIDSYKTLFTNSAERTVALSESMSKRIGKMGDVWIPLKQLIAQNVTNEQQAAFIGNDVEGARAANAKAAEQLGDIDPEAWNSLCKTESAMNRYYKMVVLPPQACDEDILAETNALNGVERLNGRDWRGEALDYTRAFRERFPAWAQAYEQSAQADTNKPPFTAEQQAEISALSTEVEKLQIAMSREKTGDCAGMATNVLAKLLRIRELLPKDGKGGSGAQNNRNQQNKNDKDKDKSDDKKDNQQQNQNEQQDQDKQRQDEQQENKEEEKQEEQQQSAEEKSDEDKKDVEDAIRRALQRTEEHDNNLKNMRQKIPLPPNERDW